MKRKAAVAFLLLVAGVVFGPAVGAWVAERKLNGVRQATAYVPTDAGAALHRKLFVADLHADALLWNRDLNKRASVGHVDVPRLVEGNVALQVFGVVTKTPASMNIDHTDGSADLIGVLFAGQRRAPGTWVNLESRALAQARQLQRVADESNGRLVVLRTRADVERLLKDRETSAAKVGGLLGLEGLHSLEGDESRLDALHAAGFRMLGLAHFFDNEVSGSAHGVEKQGLTDVGRRLVARMESLGITIDVAHASAEAIDDVLAIATRPVVVSHTGVKGTCDNNRNLSDDQLRRLAANGAVIGIGYWKTATCGTDAKAIARAIAHTVEVAGIKHVALGSDFDGAVSMPFDTAGLVQITDALLARGFDEEAIASVMGGNVLRVLLENLPAG